MTQQLQCLHLRCWHITVILSCRVSFTEFSPNLLNGFIFYKILSGAHGRHIGRIKALLCQHRWERKRSAKCFPPADGTIAVISHPDLTAVIAASNAKLSSTVSLHVPQVLMHSNLDLHRLMDARKLRRTNQNPGDKLSECITNFLFKKKEEEEKKKSQTCKF